MLRILRRSSPDSFDYLDFRLGSFRIHWFFDFDTRFLYIYWQDRFWRLFPGFIKGTIKIGGRLS